LKVNIIPLFYGFKQQNFMDLDLSGKTALVCGSSQGIGKATAMELASLGARLILLARNKEKLQEVLDELPSDQGQKHELLTADFSQPEQVSAAIDSVIGSNTIHILVNNTGGPPAGKASEAEPEEFLSAFNMHLICNHILVKAVIPGMKETNYGRIINVISTSVKQPLPNLGVSNTVRGAVANWAKTLANELGEFGITVNNVLPGATDTARLSGIVSNKANKTGQSEEAVLRSMEEAVPAKRVGKPEELAAAIAFLASPAAAYINGINLPVDGGRTKSL
jgi:3-oxoacyl-[acyl-carrier protein] reductase